MASPRLPSTPPPLLSCSGTYTTPHPTLPWPSTATSAAATPSSSSFHHTNRSLSSLSHSNDPSWLYTTLSKPETQAASSFLGDTVLM